MAAMLDTSPLACVPDAIPAGERAAHQVLTQELFSARLQETLDVSDGYAFRFAVDALEAVERFVANERRCCPFVSFEIRLAGAERAVWLKMTGPEGTRRLLAAELPLGQEAEAYKTGVRALKTEPRRTGL